MKRSKSLDAMPVAAVLRAVCRTMPLFGLGLLLLIVATPLPCLAQPPGPESFAKKPETPTELWDAVDYLVRTGQAGQAVPYLDAFLKSNPPDDVLLNIRDNYGAGSLLRLQDDPATKPYAGKLLGMMNEAAQRQAKDPERLRRFTDSLLGFPAEQRYALEQLRRAGPHAVPYLAEALTAPGRSAADRATLVDGMSRLERPAVPALIALLDSPNKPLAADAAEALGRIGDSRAIPFLSFYAGRADDDVLRGPARQAIARISGRSFDAQPCSPLQTLVSESRQYLCHQHQCDAEAEPVEFWSWQGQAPVSRMLPKAEAEGELAVRFAQQALQLDPNNREAQAQLVATSLKKVVERAGTDRFLQAQAGPAGPGAPGGEVATEPVRYALESGPEVLNSVLTLALDADLPDLAAATTSLLGRVTDRNAFLGSCVGGKVHPLLRSLSSPDRRVQFAAASALAGMGLRSAFPGDSRVVPILSQFVAAGGGPPRALVVDTSPVRGNTVGATLQGLGYDVMPVLDPREGFEEAASAANVALILIEPTGLSALGPWSARDLIANLRADARTAGIPVMVYGPLGFDDKLGGLVLDTPRTSYVVTPTDPKSFGPVLERELSKLCVEPMTPEASAGYAQRAAMLLAWLGEQPGTPFEGDLEQAREALVRGTNGPIPIAAPSALALGNIPGVGAQRRLADMVIDPSTPPEVQRSAATALTRSIQRFGPLVTVDQEKNLLSSLDGATDPTRREAVAAVIGALKPRANVIGPRLRDASASSLLPAPAADTPPASPPAPAAPAERSAAPANPEPPAPGTPETPAPGDNVPAPTP